MVVVRCPVYGPTRAYPVCHPENDPKYLDEMHRYYMETYELLFDKEEKLFARDTRFVITGAATDKRETNGNKIFWSRGNGWVLGGLALILEDMPKNYKHRHFTKPSLKRWRRGSKTSAKRRSLAHEFAVARVLYPR